jgi:hypothetical protein
VGLIWLNLNIGHTNPSIQQIIVLVLIEKDDWLEWCRREGKRATCRHQRDRGGKRASAQFVANYNGRFAKPAARDQDFHRSVDPRQDLDQILCWREQRQVSHQLVVNYSRMKLTLKPEGLAVRLRGKMVETYDFPDGRLEVRWKGRSLPYSAFDKLQRVSHAAIVENKRLGEILAWIKQQQDRQPRFNRVPDGPRPSSQKPGVLKNRALQITEAAKSCPKAHPRGRRRCDIEVSAAPANAPSEAAEWHFNFAELRTSQLCCNIRFWRKPDVRPRRNGVADPLKF